MNEKFQWIKSQSEAFLAVFQNELKLSMFLSQAGGLEESAVTGIVVGALLGAGLLMAFYFFRLGLLYKVLKFTLLNFLSFAFARSSLWLVYILLLPKKQGSEKS